MKKDLQKNSIIIYKTSKGPELEVKLKKETVWLDAHQIAALFGTQRPAIVKHINNIYQTGELDQKSTCSILEQVAADENGNPAPFTRSVVAKLGLELCPAEVGLHLRLKYPGKE